MASSPIADAPRRAVRALVPAGARYAVREQFGQIRRRGVAGACRWNGMLLDAWARERWNRSRYRVVDEPELLAERKSDTVFIFGSGYSLNDLSSEEWRAFSRHDVFGFNAFVYERWVPIDFHLLRGGLEGVDKWRAYAEEFTAVLNGNPHCANTIFLVQGEYLAQFCNQLIGYRFLRTGARIFRYRTVRGDGPPTRALRDGLRHTGGTLSDVVNAAACMGWKEIVLVGVDLYDSRYFWLRHDETYGVDEETGHLVPAKVNPRGWGPGDVHNTARNGVVEFMGEWREVLEQERGISLSVYNPRSLLANVMPVYKPLPGSSRC